MSEPDKLFDESEAAFERWEVVKDVVDETIDLVLNHRQSGHPGGSRSKAHVFLATLLSGAMRWDLLRPWRPFQDRFVLAAGHTVPLVYAALAVLNEALRERHRRTADPRFELPEGGRWALTWTDLLTFRRRGGLPGHAEMQGKTLFLKFNTGPSGHGLPAAAGEALALKLAGCEEVKVFALEGEGGLTAGSSHETKNSAWGLGLSNLVVLVDWNDFGIDEQRISSVVPGTPETWFDAHGWRVFGTEEGMEWGPVTRALLEAARGENPDGVPSAAWFRTRKGRGYGKYDDKSHGSPHPMNSIEFWERRRPFAEKYGVEYDGTNAPAPEDPDARRRQTATNLNRALDVLRRDDALIDYLSDRLVRLAREVPEKIPTFRLGGRAGRIFEDARVLDAASYPKEMFAKPGERKSEQGRARRLGGLGQRLREAGIRPAARHRVLGRSRGVHEHRRLREALRDDAGLRALRPGRESRRRAPPAGDHRVRERRPDGRARERQPGARPEEGVQRLLGRVLDLRRLRVSEVRPDAALQPARAGLRARGREGHLGRRALGTRDRRRLAHPLRHLRPRRHAALPRGAGDRPPPVGAQRGPGRPRRSAPRRRRRSSRCT